MSKDSKSVSKLHKWLFSELLSWLVSPSVSQQINQFVRAFASDPVGQSVTLSIRQAASQSVGLTLSPIKSIQIPQTLQGSQLWKLPPPPCALNMRWL